jgi:hypothetical protein
MWRATKTAGPAQAARPALRRDPMAQVDDALRIASGRRLFTRDEAIGLLRQVESVVEDPVRAARVERIVADADSGSADQLMVSCSDLVDPLLDIRLVLCT